MVSIHLWKKFITFFKNKHNKNKEERWKIYKNMYTFKFFWYSCHFRQNNYFCYIICNKK